MNNPIISICIPTYNRDECLRQCLNSIVLQFEDSVVRESVEIVISDNASTDNTEKIVNEFQRDYSNIFYYRNSENIRVDRNIINVVEKAKGDFVWFLGDDDALFEGALEHMLEELKLDKFDYCIVNCLGYNNSLSKPSVSQPNFIIESNQYYKLVDDRVSEMKKNDLVGQFCGLSMQLFKREFWKSLKNKTEHVGSNAVHVYILLSAMKGRRFAIISKPLIKVRAANIRWDVFPGLETLSKRAESTSKLQMWILDTYELKYSKWILKIKQVINLFKTWIISVLRKYLFRSQNVRDFIKRLFGKL